MVRALLGAMLVVLMTLAGSMASTAPGQHETANGLASRDDVTMPGHTEAGQTGAITVTGPDGSLPDTPTVTATSAPDMPQVTGLISAGDMWFAPDDVEVYPGQVIAVRNDGVLWHGLVVDEWGIDTGELDPADQMTFIVPDTAEVGSSVAFYCPVPGHRGAGMEGRFVVIAPRGAGSSAFAVLGAAVATSVIGP